MATRFLIMIGTIFVFSGPVMGSQEAVREQEALGLLGVESQDSHLPGVELAEGVSQVTGVAISPLLGVSVIGAWNYFRTEPEFREELPWICHPVFWGIGFGVLLVCFFKDTIGSILPAFFKKPLDLLELFEDKASAIIASAAFIPFVVARYSEGLPEFTVSNQAISHSGAATVLFGILEFGWFVTPIAIVGFFIVWVVSHTINVLIVLSPFGLLDAFLKFTKLMLLSFLGVLYFMSPVLAAVFSLCIIVICLFLAPLAFRVSVYGSVFAWDSLRSFFWRNPPPEEEVRCFLARRGSRKMKALLPGRLSLTEEGRLRFQSRWLFIGPKRTLLLPHSEQLKLTNGLMFPVIHYQKSEAEKDRAIIHLYPRYKHHGDFVADRLSLDYRETASVKGMKAVREFLVSLFKTGKESLSDFAENGMRRSQYVLGN